jgi:chitin synthase
MFPSYLKIYIANIRVQNQASVRTAKFFEILLYATAVLSCIRFMGCVWFIGRSGIMCCFTRR